MRGNRCVLQCSVIKFGFVHAIFTENLTDISKLFYLDLIFTPSDVPEDQEGGPAEYFQVEFPGNALFEIVRQTW